MMYYSVDNRTDKEVGSVFPQVSCISIKLAHAIQFDEFASFDSELLFELRPKSKLTDVLSQAAIAAHGLLINQKVKDLLSQFNLMKYRYYKCFVKDLKGGIHEYYWLHISDYSVLDKINYQESRFYLRESGFREENVELNSFEDYKNKKAELGILYTVHADSIVLADNFEFDLDIFTIPIFLKKVNISERVKNMFLTNKITGITIDSNQQIKSRD